MAYQGNGNFARLFNWVTDAANNIKIRADRMDSEMDGLATGLSTAITKDGQTTITANLPMATFRHTGVGNATARNQYLAAGQLQDGAVNWVDGGGTADAITATYAPVITALVNGMLLGVRATAANATTTPTFSPNALTAHTIVKEGGQALLVGDIRGDGHDLLLRYDLANTRWELLTPAFANVARTDAANTFTGANTFTDISTFSAQVRWAKGTDIDDDDVDGSNILTVPTDGNSFDFSGTQQVDAIATLGVGTTVRLIHTSARQLTHHATNLILPGEANITTADGDVSEWLEYATSDWRCTNYQKVDGTAVVVVPGLTLGTPQATTSGTAITFSSIPAGTKRITISVSALSTSGGSSAIIIQIGDSGGVEPTGYLGSATAVAPTPATSTITTGFGLTQGAEDAGVLNGAATLTLLNASTNLWAFSSNLGASAGGTSLTYVGAGSKALTGALDRVVLTTVNGTNTFDAGSVNIQYE